MKPGDRAALGDRLAEEIDQFSPFEALRLLQDGLTRDAEPLPVRGIVTNRHVATPLSKAPGNGEIEAAFVGLIGPLGPLPPFYTEMALREKKRRSHAFRAFLDLFLNRIVSLFVATFEKYRLPPLIARHGASGGDTVIAALYSLAGLGLPSLRHRLGIPDEQLLPYTGLFAREIRSAAGLEVILSDYFGLPVRIETFRPRWLDIEPQEQTRLSSTGTRFGRLGIDAVAGARTRDVSSTFRVIVGPLDYPAFQTFAPGSARSARLVELVRAYIDPGLDFDVQVILQKEAVPRSQLDTIGPRLGWNAWIRELPALRDADQAVFEPDAG